MKVDNMEIPLYRPTIKRQEMASVLNTMAADSIEAGELSRKFSLIVSQELGKKNGVALTNYYSAVYLALSILGLSTGDHVVISALAPSVYLQVVTDMGMVPIIVDVDPFTTLPKAEELKSVIDSCSTCRALVMAYGYGIPDYNVREIAEGIAIVEDITHLFGTVTQNGVLGGTGDVTILSTGRYGNITTGEGAVLSVEETKLLKIMRKFIRENEMFSLMPDMNASLGISLIKSFKEQVETRKRILKLYIEKLKSTRHHCIAVGPITPPVYSSFPVILEGDVNEALRFIKKNRIATGMAFKNSIISDNAKIHGEMREKFKSAYRSSLQTVLFPLYPMLANGEIEKISKVISSLP